MEKLEFGNLKEDDITHAADLCARAFLDSPSYVGIYGGTSEWRYGELVFLFESNLRMIFTTQPNSLHGGYDHSSETPKLVCFFMFPRSDTPSATLWQKISAGLLLIPLRCGFSVFSRLMTSSSHFDEIFEKALPQTHFELQRMVVDPNYQGKGIGSRCLSEALKKADSLSLPVILGTQEEINVRFYEKLGFEIYLQEKFSPTGSATDEYDNWIMIRQPKSS
jgi:ribosomal protein S18 acetylase RimI-like enzyme